MNLKGGVIAIGSLYWETEENCIDKKSSKELGKYRRIWRENNFDEKSLEISVPIRYGRKSGTRHDTYTMVFSNDIEVENNGKGKVLKYIKPINSFEELEIQAIDVAISEGIYKERNNRRLVCNWGAVGLMLNPKMKEEKKALYLYIIDKWTNLYLSYRNTFDNSKYRIDEEKPTINSNGFLNIDIDWGNLDYLFATPVEINLKKYPNGKLIAEKINTSSYSTYFLENIKEGIMTSEDKVIIDNLLDVHKNKIDKKI